MDVNRGESLEITKIWKKLCQDDELVDTWICGHVDDGGKQTR